MNSHPLNYSRSYTASRPMEQKSRHPPMILTPHEVPEFVIPRSPLPQSHSSEVEQLPYSFYEEKRGSRSSRLLVPQVESMRGRSHSSPSSPDMPRITKPSQYSPSIRADIDPPRRQRRYSYQPQSVDSPQATIPTSRKYSRDAAAHYDRPERHHSFSPSERRHRMSPDGHRRRLPPTPEELHAFNYEDDPPRPSRSRQLPSPPIRHQYFPSPEGESPSRTASGGGRRLPSVPTQDLSNGFRIESRIRQAERDVSARVTSLTPPPKNNHRTPSNSYSNGYQPDVHETRIISPGSRKYCQRRTSEQSLQDYVETPCTCPESQASSLSPSQELISHSSSDTEDPSALGIAPEVYHQSEQTNIMQTSVSSSSGFADFRGSSVEDSPSKKEVSDPARNATVPTSTSWSEASELGQKKTGLGLLHFCVQYFPVRKRLRVSIMKAEGLAGQLRPDLELHTFVKICLIPGKIGKEHSRIVKRDRDAVFNQEFFFDNVTGTEIRTKSISIRVCHHVGKQFQKDIMIGEIEVPLKDVPDLLTKKEIRLTESLKPKLNLKKLGRITISACLETEARRLTINVIKADNLPKYGITGPPDPCIRIKLNQNGRIQTKQTRTLKNTTSAVYREAVMFLVSIKPQDLDNTELTIAVVDTKRSASGEDVVGEAFLGCLAADKTETEQWKNTLLNPGKEYKATHSLKLPKED